MLKSLSCVFTLFVSIIVPTLAMCWDNDLIPHDDDSSSDIGIFKIIMILLVLMIVIAYIQVIAFWALPFFIFIILFSLFTNDPDARSDGIYGALICTVILIGSHIYYRITAKDEDGDT